MIYSKGTCIEKSKPKLKGNPVSRGLFSAVFAELTGVRKSDLCPGSKRTVMSMRHSYLATEPSQQQRLNQNPFQPRAEVSFPRARQFNEHNRKEVSATTVDKTR